MKLSDAQSGQTNQTATRKLSKAKINVSYSNNGSDYMFQEEKSGYKMTSANTKNSVNPYAVLRASSREGYYIMYQNNKSSFGYFDQFGNFVVENYDPATDSVVATKYLIQETGGIKPMRTESENLNETDLKNQRMKEDQKMKNRKNRKLKGGKK